MRRSLRSGTIQIQPSFGMMPPVRSSSSSQTQLLLKQRIFDSFLSVVVRTSLSHCIRSTKTGSGKQLLRI
jgi:hypothetical protein